MSEATNHNDSSIFSWSDKYLMPFEELSSFHISLFPDSLYLASPYTANVITEQ